jgi:hypothetical protein
MIRSFVARAGAQLSSAALAFLFVASIAVPVAQAKNMNFPDSCTVTVDASGNVSMTCGAPPPPPPPGALACSILGAPSGNVAANAAISLTMNCTGGTTPYRYLWTPGGGTSATLATTVAATTTFSVTATDAANATSTQSVTVTVSTGGGGTGLCSQYTNVLPTVNVGWGQAGSWQSTGSGNFGSGDSTIWVFRMVAGAQNSSIIGRFTISEFQGPSTFRQMTLSTEACDFRGKQYTGIGGPLAVSNGTTASVSYAVATPFIFGPAGLTPGQTYYINVRNWQLDPYPQNSCNGSTCNALMNNDPALP